WSSCAGSGPGQRTCQGRCRSWRHRDVATATLVFLWFGITAYAVLAGADFGAGIWDLLGGGVERGRAVRGRIAASIGPVWEANHVWLIFALVVLWTAFPPAF